MDPSAGCLACAHPIGWERENAADRNRFDQEFEQFLVESSNATSPSSHDQPKDRNLRPAVETDGKQVSQAAADVEPATVIEVELAGGVAAIFHGQERRRQKGRLALTAVRVAREDPSLKSRPVVLIDG